MPNCCSHGSLAGRPRVLGRLRLAVTQFHHFACEAFGDSLVSENHFLDAATSGAGSRRACCAFVRRQGCVSRTWSCSIGDFGCDCMRKGSSPRNAMPFGPLRKTRYRWGPDRHGSGPQNQASDVITAAGKHLRRAAARADHTPSRYSRGAARSANGCPG